MAWWDTALDVGTLGAYGGITGREGTLAGSLGWGGLGDAWDAVSGQTDYRTQAYDPAKIDAAQQPWLSSLSTAAGARPADTAVSELAQERVAIDPTRTRNQLEGIGSQFSADASRQSAGIEGVAGEVAGAPSYADEASRAAMDRASGEAIARAAGARGPNAALQMREAAGMNAGAARMAASEAGALKAKEMNDRFALRGDLLSRAAGVTATGAQGAGSLASAAGGAELAARGARAGMSKDSGTLGLQQQQQQTAAATAGGQLATSGQGIAAGSHDSSNMANANIATGNASNMQQTTGGMMMAAGGLMMSDVRNKEDIEEIPATLDAWGEAGALPDNMYSPPKAPSAQSAEFGFGLGGGARGNMGRDMFMKGLSQLSDAEAKRDAKLAGKRELLASLSKAAGANDARQVPSASYPTPRQQEMAESPEANREALAPMRPYTFRYKPATAARMGTDTAPRPGIMAQDMERSPYGDEVVEETPAGKALDGPRALGFALAGNAGLDKRVSSLEEKLKRAAGGRR